jgi:hypothetical protein
MAQNRHHALAREAILAALTAYTGITTADGLPPDGTTIIDTNLIGANDFISNKTILIGSGDANKEDRGAVSFDNTTGVITVVSAFKDSTGVATQIKAGTLYRILNISSVEIDVAIINAKIGTNVDAAGTTTVFARLKQIVDTYLASGTHGLAAIKTVVDAILVGTGTTLPVALATIIAYVDELETRLSAARAGYLDNLIGTVTPGTFSLVNNANEQDCLIFNAATQQIDVELDMSNLVQINTVREKVQVDGAAYRQISAKAFPTAFDTDTKCVILSFVQKNSAYKITLQATGAEGSDKDVKYRYIVRDLV